MDKSDGVSGKREKSVVKKSESSEDGGKVYKLKLVETFKFRCYQ